MEKNSFKVSVVIPTYKRPIFLLNALQSLDNQSRNDFEVIVVDNASDADIENKVRVYARQAKIPIRYFTEPRLGVHYARNLAATLAEGSLLLYTDDDMTFSPQWISAYIEKFDEHPEMVAASGPVHPYWEEQPPQWLLDYIGGASVFYLLSFMKPFNDFQLSRKGFFFSCNMAIKKEVLFLRHGFHPEATGSEWLGDGESGLNRVMWENGDWIGYIPEALGYHHIPRERMTREYLLKRMENEGASVEYGYFNQRQKFDHKSAAIRQARIMMSLSILPIRAVQNLLKGKKFVGLNFSLYAKFHTSRLRYINRMIKTPEFRDLVLKTGWL